MASLYEQDIEAKLEGGSLFRRIDFDKSGSLSQRELLKVREIMVEGDDFGDSGLCPLDEGADANGDGAVDESEWHEFCGSLYELMGRKSFVSAVKRWSDKAIIVEWTPAPVEVCDESAAKEAAAQRIQKAHRGKKARKEVAAKKQEKQASAKAKAKAKSSGHHAAEQFPIITVAELWELLVLSDGRVVNRMDVADLVDLFWKCKRTGLDLSLAKYAPMQFTDEVEPEDLSPREVAELCKLLVAKEDVSEKEARAALAPFKHTREEEVDPVAFRKLEGGFNLRRFKKFLALLSSLLRIDQDYIITHMQWPTIGCFETTDALAAAVLDRCGRAADVCRGSIGTQYSLNSLHSLPDMRLLEKPVDLKTFERLVRNCKILDSREIVGISYGNVGLIFQRAVKNLPKRLQDRLSARRRNSEVAPKKKEEFFGRNEFEVLLQELSQEPAMRNMYSSPLRMLTGFLERVQEPIFNIK